MAQPIAVVDAFTAEPYRGNPAGICVLPAAASDEWMQSVAIEMNHAETAFLIKCGANNQDGYNLRWVTPGGEVDVVSRCFFPRFHIDEDPVTGSAHCALAPYWIPRLGKQEIVAYQASTRGGWLRLRLAGDRVKLRGQAVTTLRGELAHHPPH